MLTVFQNERICATALYYYDSENITESRLAFRTQLDEESGMDFDYPQNHHEWLNVLFGLEDNGPMIQELGSINCKEGRLLTFPNVFQHRVQPFKLADPSKPGHRKIVALFLVDPHVRVLSTADVPAQRKDWWERMVNLDDILVRLPRELQDQVEDDIGFPMTMDEAKEHRLELMEQRANFVHAHNTNLESYTFSLCEH